MKSLLIFTLFLNLISFSVFAQIDIKYTEAIREVQENMLNNDFSESFTLLKKLENEGYANANMSYLMGICSINSLTNKVLSVDYFKNASNSISNSYNPDDSSEVNAPVEALLYLGDAYLVNNKIKEARLSYLKYLNYPKLSENKMDIARSRLKNCLFARLHIDNPLDIKIENAGKTINSGISNSNACISADGKKMVFMRSMKFYDAILYSTKSDTGWSEPVNITTQIGSDGEYTPTALSPDGNKILLKSFFDPYGYEIYESSFNGRKWSKVKRLESPVNSKYHDIDASYSEDGSSIYFSSNRIGGIGGYDIYKASYNLQNKQYSVENMGNTINSPGNEKVPSIIENGKVIIFNSDYYTSIGGYDFYYCQLLDGEKWSEPLDVGYPINSTSNDYNLRFTSVQPRKGFLSRNEVNGYSGSDISFFDCPVFSTLKLVPLSGKLKINDATFNRDITLAVIDVAEKDTAFILQPNEDGSYYAELYPGNFDLIVKKGDSTELTQSFAIPKEFNKDNFILDVKDEIKPQEVKKQIDTLYISDILFEFNQWNIQTSENQILLNIINNLRKYPVKSIKLLGYSDAIGNELYNKTLSEKRAASVKDFFNGQGINISDIKIEGLGASHFIARNTNGGGKDNPEGRQYNRRVEIQVLMENNSVVIIRKERVPEKLKL
jgi:outer membrane protein OmpA-like peptidoglycan-associated protein/Tol biopolymer transport system component